MTDNIKNTIQYLKSKNINYQYGNDFIKIEDKKFSIEDQDYLKKFNIQSSSASYSIKWGLWEKGM